MFVHGRGQQRENPAAIAQRWRDGLDRGLAALDATLPEDIQIDFPFYGDILDDFARRTDLPIDGTAVAKGGQIASQYVAFRAEVAQEMAAGLALSDAEILAEMGPGAGERGPQNWAWVQAIVRLVDRRVTGLSGATIERFLRDVFLYTHRPAVRRAVDALIVEELSDTTVMVVAHSLGTVVAYNVLSTARTKPGRFVTIASPLAIRAIRRTLGPIDNPAGRLGWHNAFDRRDVVALYPLDAANFAVQPPITNDADVQNSSKDHHSITRYLEQPSVAQAILIGLH